MVIKAAYLRVYTTDAGSSNESVPGFIHSVGVMGDEEHDRVVDWEGRPMRCPTNLRLRALESTVAFANAFRGSVIIPEETVRAADRALRDYHRSNPDHRSHVLASAWHVPVRWFTAFDPSERQLYESPSGMRPRFRTSMADARSRAMRALRVLEELGAFQAPAEELAQFIEWLDRFPGDAMVELDYGTVAELFEQDDLLFDDSCELVHASLDALEEGDMLRAGENYGRVVARWAHAYSLSFAS